MEKDAGQDGHPDYHQQNVSLLQETYRGWGDDFVGKGVTEPQKLKGWAASDHLVCQIRIFLVLNIYMTPCLYEIMVFSVSDKILRVI